MKGEVGYGLRQAAVKEVCGGEGVGVAAGKSHGSKRITYKRNI